MIDAPTTPTPPRPIPGQMRGIGLEELDRRPRILRVVDECDLGRFEAWCETYAATVGVLEIVKSDVIDELREENS